MTEMIGKTTLNLYRSIHKTTPGYDAGPIVDGVAVTGVLYPDFESRRISKTRTRPADLTSFKIRFTGHNKTFDADHYQIESIAGTMAMDAMKGALDNLARNAIVRLVAIGDITAPIKV